MILIDHTLNTSVGNSLNDLREFISAQAPSMLIGVGYLSNASVTVVQNFAADHEADEPGGSAPVGLVVGDL